MIWNIPTFKHHLFNSKTTFVMQMLWSVLALPVLSRMIWEPSYVSTWGRPRIPACFLHQQAAIVEDSQPHSCCPKTVSWIPTCCTLYWERLSVSLFSSTVSQNAPSNKCVSISVLCRPIQSNRSLKDYKGLAYSLLVSPLSQLNVVSLSGSPFNLFLSLSPP